MSSSSLAVRATLRGLLLSLLSEPGGGGGGGRRVDLSSLSALFVQRVGRRFEDASGGQDLAHFLMDSPNDFVVEQPVRPTSIVLLRADWEAQQHQAAHAAQQHAQMAYTQLNAGMHAHHPNAMMYAQQLQQQQQHAAWQAQQMFQATHGGPATPTAAPPGGAGMGVGAAADPTAAGVITPSATAAILHLRSFTTAGIIDELMREFTDSYGVSGGSLPMPIFHKCALLTAWGKALAAVHGEAQAKNRIEATVRQNPEVFLVREQEGQPHAMVSLAPAMVQAFASASAPPTPTHTATAAKPSQTPQPKQAATAAAATPASSHTASTAAQPSSRPPPSPAASGPPLATPLDLQGLLVDILRHSPHQQSLTSLGISFMSRAKRSFNDACAAAGVSKTLRTFIQERPSVFRVEADARPEHPPIISLVPAGANGAASAGTPSSTPARPRQTGSAMSTPAGGAGSIDLEGTLVSVLRESSRAMPIPTLATRFRELTGVAFKDTGVAQTMTEFLAERPGVFRLEEDGRPQHPRLVSLADGPAAARDASSSSAAATPIQSRATASSSSGDAMHMASPAPAPTSAGPPSDAQLELIIHILRGAPKTPGSLPLATLTQVFKARTGFRFDDADAAASGRGSSQTLLDYLAERPDVFRIWTEGVNRTHLVALKSATRTFAGAEAGAGSAAGASPSNASQATSWRSTGTPAAAAASPSTGGVGPSAAGAPSSAAAAAIDLQRVLVSLLVSSPDAQPLNSLADLFRVRTGYSFSDALAAADKKQSMTAWLKEHSDVFHVEADPREKYPPLVSLVPAYRNRLRPAPATAVAVTTPSKHAGGAGIGHSGAGAPVADLSAAFADASISTPESKSQPVCRYWPKGFCHKGDNCSHFHDPYYTTINRDLAVAKAATEKTAAPDGSAPTPKRMCHYYPKGFCHKGDGCSHWHDPQYDAINQQKAAEKAAAAERQRAGAAGEGEVNGAAAGDYYPSTTSGSAAATAVPSASPFRARPPAVQSSGAKTANESAAVDLICSLLPADGSFMLPSALGDAFLKRAPEHGFHSWSDYSSTFGGGPSLQRWMERHPDRIVVDKTRGTTPGKVLVRRAQVEGAEGAAAAPRPHSQSRSSFSSPAPSSSHSRVGVNSPPPSTTIILGWVCAMLLRPDAPTTLTDLGQAMRRQHGAVFISVGSAAERAHKAAVVASAASGSAPPPPPLTMKAFMKAHPDMFSMQPAGDEVRLGLVNRSAAQAAAAAVAGAAPMSFASSAPAPSSAYTTPHKPAHAAASMASPATSAPRQIVKRGTAPTQGLPLDGWSRASLSPSSLLGLLIGHPTQAVYPPGSGFYPVPDRPFGTGMLLSLLHRTPLGSLWQAAFPDWEALYDFLRTYPSHFAPADHLLHRSALARWVVRDEAPWSVPSVAAPTAAEAKLLHIIETVFRTAAPSQQPAMGAGGLHSPPTPALSLDAIGRGFFLEKGQPFESLSGGVTLADFLLHFRNLFLFYADGPLLVVRFRPMEEEAQAEAQEAPAPAMPAPSSAPQPAAAAGATSSSSASAPPPVRKMPIAVLASTDEGGASSEPAPSQSAAMPSSSSSSDAQSVDWLGEGEVFFQAGPAGADGASGSAQVAPSADAEPPSYPTPATSSTQLTVRMRVHVSGRDAPVSVSADSVAELREELAQKLDEDEEALAHAHFSLYSHVDGQPLPPVLTDEQLWALTKNSAVYAIM